MLKKRILSFAYLTILLGGCQDYGDRSPSCDLTSCPLYIKPGSLTGTIRAKSGGSVSGNLKKYASNEGLAFKLCDDKRHCVEFLKPKTTPCGPTDPEDCRADSGINFSVSVTPAELNLAGISAGQAYFTASDTVPFRRLRQDESPPSYEIQISNKPLFQDTPEVSGMVPALIERLGFVMGGKLMSFRSYKQVTIKQSFSQYTLASSTITQDAPSGYVFSNTFGDDPVTGDIGQDRVVWLEVDGTKGLALVNCPLTAAGFSDCSNPDSSGYPNNRVPLDIKAFAISPDAKYAVISEVNGTLRFASLPTQPMTPPALVWNPLGMQPAPTRKDRVLTAWADLTGDGVLDLVAVHQDATGQDVTVYRGSGSGTLQLTYEAGLSMTWGSAMGTMPIDAMALGSLDQDNLADLAVGRGTQLSVWLNGGTGAAVEAWSAMVPVSAGHTIRALAIGPVDGMVGPNDLVVASSTTPDSMGMASQFIHAYLGQPQ